MVLHFPLPHKNDSIPHTKVVRYCIIKYKNIISKDAKICYLKFENYEKWYTVYFFLYTHR